MAASSAAFLQSQKLLGTECFVMDLACRFNKVLEMGASEEVPQRDELAMGFIFDVNDTPAVLPAADLFPIDNNGLFAANHSERNNILCECYVRDVYIEDPFHGFMK